MPASNSLGESCRRLAIATTMIITIIEPIMAAGEQFGDTGGRHDGDRRRKADTGAAADAQHLGLPTWIAGQTAAEWCRRSRAGLPAAAGTPAAVASAWAEGRRPCRQRSVNPAGVRARKSTTKATLRKKAEKQISHLRGALAPATCIAFVQVPMLHLRQQPEQQRPR